MQKLLILAVVGPFLGVSAYADSILNISSLQTVGTITGSTTSISFQPLAPLTNCNVGGGNTGIFASLPGTCSVENFNNSPAFTESGFITLSGLPGFTDNLLGLDVSPAPSLGPTISLIQIAPNLVSASIGLFGTAQNGSQSYMWNGVLSAQVAGTVAGVQSGGLPPTSWSGTLDVIPATPEPSSWLSLSASFIGLGWLGRRRRIQQ